MPGPSATKPGDVYVISLAGFIENLLIVLGSIYAMNGKTVEVDNTDAEGRLVLAGTPPASRRVFFC